MDAARKSRKLETIAKVATPHWTGGILIVAGNPMN
jgi:hypothetical protein